MNESDPEKKSQDPARILALQRQVKDLAQRLAETQAQLTADRVRHEMDIRRRIAEMEFHVRQRLQMMETVTEQLRRNEEQLRALLDNLPDIAWLKNPEGRYSAVNKAFSAFVGRPEQEVVGRQDGDLFGAAEAEQIAKTDALARREKRSLRFEGTLKGAAGVPLLVETVKSPILDDNGSVTGLIGIARDITERRQEEVRRRDEQERLFQADKMIALGTLVSGMAHEINNPINFIMLNASILKDAWTGCMPVLEAHYAQNGDFTVGHYAYSRIREKMGDLLSGLNDGGDRIKHIVQDLRNFARPDPSDMADRVNVNDVVQSAVTILSSKIKKTAPNFSMQCELRLPDVRGSFQKIEQVIINLIQNACEALPSPQKRIWLTTRTRPDRSAVIMSVKDEGLGIAADVLPHIFDPFYTTKRGSGGTGLGLAISKKIVELHRGTIEVESVPEQGTRFTIILPAEESDHS